MAELFEAIGGTPAGERRVVLKRLRPELASEPELVAMFRHEARLQQALRHPNAVACYGLHEQAGVVELVLEHVDGCSLAEAIARCRAADRALDPALVLWIARELCRGLEAVHALVDETGRSLGAVHRDVTPANTLLSRAGEVKLGDLGVAKSRWSQAKTRSGEVKGSLRYLSPEQARGDQVGPLSDLYGVGLLMYEALALEPYRLGSARELMASARAPRWRPLRAHSPATPPAVEKLVQRCLRVEPETRPASASALAAALSQLVARAARLPGPEDVAALVLWALGEAAAAPAQLGAPPVAHGQETEPCRPAAATRRDTGPTVSLARPPARAVQVALRSPEKVRSKDSRREGGQVNGDEGER